MEINSIPFAPFWSLAYGRTTNLRHVLSTNVRLFHFDHTGLLKGQIIESPLPDWLKLVVEPGDEPLADHLANPLGWTIMSNRLVKFLWPLIKNSVQLLSAPLFEEAGYPLDGYHVLNVTRVIDCVDRERSSEKIDRFGYYSVSTNLVLDPKRILDANMFKFLHPMNKPDLSVTCSSNLLNKLRGEDFTGLAFIPYALPSI